MRLHRGRPRVLLRARLTTSLTPRRACSPEPLEAMPVEEMRSLAVEAKLSHESSLRKLLDAMLRENDALEAGIAAQDGRAKRVQASITSRVEEFARVGGSSNYAQ